jgi:hypothetical protein
MPNDPVEFDTLGSDFAGVFDMDPNLSFVSGRMCHLQAVARAWLQAPGSEPDAPHIGLGLAQLIGDDFDARNLQADAERQALYDERTMNTTVVATDDGNGNITLNGTIEDEVGPLSFVLTPTSLTSTILKLQV